MCMVSTVTWLVEVAVLLSGEPLSVSYISSSMFMLSFSDVSVYLDWSEDTES
jgi:hypothetical protein